MRNDRIEREAAALVAEGYRRLVPMPVSARRLLQRLILPAMRLHRYRGAGNRSWQQAIRAWDCKAAVHGGDHGGQPNE